MNEANMKPGVRVRVARDIVLAAGQSAGIEIPMGATGTVEEYEPHGDGDPAIGLVCLDNPVEGLIGYYSDDGRMLIVWDWTVPECTAEDFEAIDPVLTTHTIAVHFLEGDIPTFFVCEAEDEDHAFEQAAKAYPEYNMVTVADPDDYLLA